MQIAGEVRKIFQLLGGEGKNPKQFTLEDFKIKYDKVKVSQDEGKKEQDKLSKMRWFAAVGGYATIDNRDGTYTLPNGKRITEKELNSKGTKGI